MLRNFKILIDSVKLIFTFFLLGKKETKTQGERPTAIYPAKSSQNGGSLSFAKKQPHYYQCMINSKLIHGDVNPHFFFQASIKGGMVIYNSLVAGAINT